MQDRPPAILGFLAHAIRVSAVSFTLWVPALIVLFPTLALQLAAPTYLRTRLSPSPWFVILGSVTLLLMTQIAMPAVFALVHALRTGTRPASPRTLLRVSWQAGVRSFGGLLLGIAPGVWLQARYAFAAMAGMTGMPGEEMSASAAATRPVLGRLMVAGTVALIMSALGQSLVAVLNDALGVVSAVGSLQGRTTFALHYPAHVLTTVVAYVCAAGAATLHAVAVSIVREGLFETARVSVVPSQPATPALPRYAVVLTLVVLLAGIAAAAFKIQQHVS
jgi:hypothetical protein